MQPQEGPASDNAKTRARDKSSEPLPPLVSAALEPGTPSLSARLERISTRSNGAARYTVLGDLARGGMGRILRAWDEGLSREVAMKVVPREALPGASDEERADHERRLARFLDEARITGQLDHPGIVPVYELGLSESGEVFFTMPLVRGEDLKHVFARVHRREQGWTLQRAVDVMHTVCLTVAFAHQKGVVHRDLKPENIMVGPFGEAYVMDWGLAFLLGRAERSGIVGTPAYMSPEQARGRSAEVGPCSDVYSLGAILYELFARRMPHELSLEATADQQDGLQHVLASPPRPLSELGSDVPAELAAICAKAMARAPTERYASALEMADDLAAWLAGRAVSALATGPWERLRKWRTRNRALSLALEALVALVIVSTVALVWQQRTWLKEVRAGHTEVRVSAYGANLSAADLGLRAHESGEARRRLVACDPELRGWEWRHLTLRADSSAAVLEGHAGGVRAVAVDPAGERLASGSDDGTVRLWDATSGAPGARLVGHAGVVTAVVFAPDGARLASASRDDRVVLWDLACGAPERVISAHGADVMALAFADDGTVLASGDADGGVTLARVADGTILAQRRSETTDGLVALDFLPGTGELAAAYISGTVRILGREHLELLREACVARTTLTALDVDPLGATLAVAFERTAQILDVHTLEPVHTLGGHGRQVTCVAFDPSGSRLATTSYDNVLRVWELASGRRLEFEGHDSDVNSAAFYPDGERLVTGAEDEDLRLWDLARAPVTVLLELGVWVDALAFSPDGTRLLAGAHDRSLRLFDVARGLELERVETSGIVDCVAFGAGERLAYGCGEPAPRAGSVARLAACTPLEPGEGFPKALCIAPDGARLFSRDSKGAVYVHELAGPDTRVLRESEEGYPSLALSRDGRLLAAGTVEGRVILWDTQALDRPVSWRAGNAAVTALAFAPDGARLAVGLQNRSIVLLRTVSGIQERVLEGHDNIVSCLAFSPDGKRLVAGSYDHTLRIWTPDDAQALLTLHGHGAPVMAVAFDPSGEIVASASKDGTLRLWRTARTFEVVARNASTAPR